MGYSPWGRNESDTTKRLHFLSLSGGKKLILKKLTKETTQSHAGLGATII